MSLQIFQTIEQLITEQLWQNRELLLPDICVLSILRTSASITPDGNTIIPPQDTLEIYHPDSFCTTNLVDIVADKITAGNLQQAQQLYWQFISWAMPDNVTLTINSLAVMNMETAQVIAVSPQVQTLLSPAVPIYVAQQARQVEQTVQTEQSPYNNVPPLAMRTKQQPRQSTGAVWVASIISVAAAIYVAYYFVSKYFL